MTAIVDSPSAAPVTSDAVTLSVPEGPPTAYDADAQAYFERVESEDGQTLEPDVKTAINDFVVGCKADGIWDAIKASFILAGARTLSGALQPLVGTAPTNFNFVPADYNRKTGLKGNGVTKYLDSNRDNSADPQDSQHLSIFVTELRTTGSTYMGTGSSQSGSSNLGTGFVRSRNASENGLGSSGTLTGFVGISRGSSTDFQARSGSTNITFSRLSETPLAGSVFVYARNINGPLLYSDPRLAFYSIGESIDLTLLDTRVSALMTAIDAALFDSPSTYDTDAQAYFDRVEGADSQTLEPAVKTAINDFVVGCKDDGIWDAIKASCILAGARTLSGALQPLVGTAPTNYNFVPDDYDRKTGLVGDAITKYLNSNRANNADPQDSQHLSVFVTELRTTGSTYMGAGGSGAGSSNLGTGFARSRNASSDGGFPATQAGFVGISRGSSVGYQARSGSTNTTFSRISEPPLAGDIFVYARNINGPLLYSDPRLAFFSIGEALDLAALDTRVSNLITAIGAAIP
jgi:hypothetical protein